MINVAGAAAIPAMAPAASFPLLAHQGGWDEILLVVGPMLVVAGLLWVAKRRATRRQDGAPEGTRSIAAPTARNRPTKSS